MKQKKYFQIGDKVHVIVGANINGYDNMKGVVVDVDIQNSKQPNICVLFDNTNDMVWCYPDPTPSRECIINKI